ncbi:MAG: hypothetical protein J6L83_09420, partial [Clostridia bacterium]|nr:hypothetical protein [Clostridia bacterium]
SERAALDLRTRLADTSIKVVSGETGICDAIRESKCDTVVNAILGEAGLCQLSLRSNPAKDLPLPTRNPWLLQVI